MPTPVKPAVFERQAAIFGVCEALGDDFGISAYWFRLALAPAAIVWPLWTLLGYFALGLIVMATRLLIPDVVTPAATVDAVPAVDDPAVAEELRLAA